MNRCHILGMLIALPAARQCFAAAALGMGLCCALAGMASAQEDPMKRPRLDTNVPAQGPQQPPPGVGVVKQQSRPFYLQGAVVALLSGGAVWTVCRGSRRQ